MSQVAFASRSDLVASLHTRISGVITQIEATESEIRSVQFEQAIRSDARQTRQHNYPHPQSKPGRDGIRECRDRIKGLRRKVSTLHKQRRSLREEARYQENIVSASHRPLRSSEPMRKL